MTTPNPVPSVSYQCPLRPALPCIYGPVEYREERDLYERIDRLLHTTGVEQACISAAFAQSGRDWSTATPAAVERFGRYASIGLRCAVARSLTGLSLRGLTTRAADSTTLAWFLGTADLCCVQSPSKSTVHRLGEQVDAATLRHLNELLTAAAIAPVLYLGETATQPAGLDLPVVPDDIYFDATCLKAPVHLPTDWVLLRDAVRTLMLATACIRRAGLKVRMPQEPLAFLSDINALCMQMAAQRRRPDSKKNRKATLRLMKKLTDKVAGHARSHRDLLTARHRDSALSEKEAARVTARIDNILTQLPAAMRQAHERIIGERQVPNDEKLLEGAGLRSGLCPRKPGVLAQRLRDEPWLRAGLKRRGATETRIAIFKNVFCQGQLREKSHDHRELAAGRAVLAHNLYILPKLQIAQEKASRQAIAKTRERRERREAA